MQPQPTDPTALAYRVSTVEKDILQSNQRIQHVESQFQQYVSQRENELQQREKELQLRNIEQAVERIERDQQNGNIKIDNLGKKIDDTINSTLKWVVGIFVGALVIIATSLIIYYWTRPGG